MSTESLHPRKKPRQQRAAEMVELILQAATRILETESLAGFNTNRVAQVAGISIGSFYQYFPNKNALMAALIVRAEAEFASGFAELVDSLEDTPFPEALRKIAGLVVRQQFGRPLLAAALDHEERRLPVAEHLAAGEARMLDSVERLLARYRDDLSPDLSPDAARDCFIIAKALVDESGLIATEPPPDLENRLVRALCGYLTVTFSFQTN